MIGRERSILQILDFTNGHSGHSSNYTIIITMIQHKKQNQSNSYQYLNDYHRKMRMNIKIDIDLHLWTTRQSIDAQAVKHD